MSQGELFDLEIVQEINEDGYVCIKCDIRQPLSNFQQMSYKNTENAEVKRTCKSCSSGHRRVIADLRKIGRASCRERVEIAGRGG